MAKKNSANIRKYNKIPTKLSENQFNAFILPHLSVGKRGPKCSIPLHKVFNTDFHRPFNRNNLAQPNSTQFMKQ